MRISKKTYTKRRRGTKKRNYKKKVKSKRIGGGEDLLQGQTKARGRNTLRRRDLEKLRKKSPLFNEKTVEQPDEHPYPLFEQKDFEFYHKKSNEIPEPEDNDNTEGYNEGLSDAMNSKHSRADFHYSDMPEDDDYNDNKEYINEYRRGYAVGLKQKEEDDE
jgi:hypothetical protein